MLYDVSKIPIYQHYIYLSEPTVPVKPPSSNEDTTLRAVPS